MRMSSDRSAMPAPTSTPTATASPSSTPSPASRPVKESELLSPTSAAVVHAVEQRIPKPGQVTAGSLRIKVVQVTDLVDANAASASPSSTSWLRRRAPATTTKSKTHTGNTGTSNTSNGVNAVCVLLKISSSSHTFATSAVPRGEAVYWNEEFFFDDVTTKDELRLVCVDRTKNEPYANLPLRSDDTALQCTGFIGKVLVPLVRLPEGEEIEQWYPLVPKDAFLSLRTALRVSICFTPVGGRVRSARAESSVMERPRRPPPLTMTQERDSLSPSPHLLPPPSPLGGTPQAVTIAMGLIDYAIIVGPQESESCAENAILFRYPETDRPGFPLPTKVEWFCFPGGPEVVEQVERPSSKVFSFILVGGTDGLSRVYVVCAMVYHRPRHSQPNIWNATCIAFLTRVPLLDEITTCLLSFVHAWLAQAAPDANTTDEKPFAADRLLVDLSHGIVTPIRGVYGVEFDLPPVGRLKMVLPTDTTIHHNFSDQGHHRVVALRRNSNNTLKSPTKSPSMTSVSSGNTTSFQPLVYSLEAVFQHFDVKSIIEIIGLMLCEYRILIHSSQMSVLCPVAEGLCALIYPFRWQHPYIPILPCVLSEYLQAPLPYVLGVNSSWLPDLLENGRPDHLVLVDIDRGSIQRHDGGPVLPPKLTRTLHRRVNRLLYPELSECGTLPATVPNVTWTARQEELIRGEFVSYLSTMLKGYRECLFFVNQKLPVFNKRRFFATFAADNEATPFLTRLFCTQAFQAFLENHDAGDLSVFHAVYNELTRGKEALVWPHSCLSWLANSRSDSLTRISKNSSKSSAHTPVYAMHDETAPSTSTTLDPEALGEAIETLLAHTSNVCDLLARRDTPFFDPTVMGNRFAELMNRTIDYHDVADALSIDPKLLEDHKDWLKNPHEVNQHHMRTHIPGASHHFGTGIPSSNRNISRDDERMEQLLHKCLTSVFTSDDQLTADEIKACEGRFKNQHARELFVLILMQPSQQYVDTSNSSVSNTWYNPKGSGSCIGEAGFQLLARLSAMLLDQCAAHEDFTNARGMLQVAAQFYHLVDDKHSGIVFAKKEYLVQVLRVRPVCRSLDMWQHAFSREIDAVLLAAGEVSGSNEGDPPAAVSDEVFFSVIGSLIFDMLTVDVPVGNVQTFVTVMCSTYQKDRDMRDTLKQLVENVFRAVEMSKDAPPLGALTASTSPLGTPASHVGSDAPSRSDISPTPVVARSQYDLDTVIRRKMSVQDVPPTGIGSGRRTPTGPDRLRQNGKTLSPPGPSQPRRAGENKPAYTASTTVLCAQSSPVLSLSVYHGRVACGLTEPLALLTDDAPLVEKRCNITKLEGHTDAVIAVQMQGQTVITGSRDGTLRAWDLKTSPRKRHLFGFLSSSSSSTEATTSGNGSTGGRSATSASTSRVQTGSLDGAVVSRKCLVMKGHSSSVTCLELGRQLSTDRALVASASMDSTIRLWDTSKETSVAVLSAGGTARHGLSCLRYLALTDYLVSGVHEEFSLKAWDLNVSKLRNSVPAHRGCIRDIQVTGDRLVTAANDRVAKVWDARFRDGPTYSHALRGHGGPVLCLSLGGPADPNICTGSADGVVRVWDLRYVQKGPRLALTGHQGPVTCLQRDFTRLVSGSEDGGLRLWDMHSGVCLKEVRAHQSGVTCMVLRDASVYSGSWDGSVRHWDVEVPIRTL